MTVEGRADHAVGDHRPRLRRLGARGCGRSDLGVEVRVGRKAALSQLAEPGQLLLSLALAGGRVVTLGRLLPLRENRNDLARTHRWRSEEHTSEIQTLNRIMYIVFLLYT